MPPTLTIKAKIVDISTDTPNDQDKFFVDTNVWFWMTYNKSMNQNYRLQKYPPYLLRVLSSKSCVNFSGLSLAELSHIIEKEEYKIFNSTTPLTIKEYRHNFDAERKKVVAEIDAAWGQVRSMGTQINLNVDEKTTDKAKKLMTQAELDGYDLYLIETMRQNNINNIITDDGDFATVENITVFTANKNVIEQAIKQKKIVKR